MILSESDWPKMPHAKEVQARHLAVLIDLLNEEIDSHIKSKASSSNITWMYEMPKYFRRYLRKNGYKIGMNCIQQHTISWDTKGKIK